MASVWPLVGREEELRLINSAVTGADDYGGVVIAGPPGVGKSRLAHESITHLGHGRWVPRWARATASARALPLGAFAEWAGDIASDPLLVVRGVIDHLTNAPTGTKVVIGVDDAHLLDDLSAFVVHQLVQRRLASVVITLRTGESAPDAVTALWKDGLLQRVELQLLSEKETGHLITAVLGGLLEPNTARGLWTFTRGNVLYLRHLLEQELASNRLTEHQGVWEWTGQPVVSPGLADLIDTQIGALPDTVGAVLDYLAVGEPLLAQILADLTGPDAIETAHSKGLITIDSGERHPVRLTHPLYGEARRAQSTPLRLRRLRSQLATILTFGREAGPRDLVRRAVLTVDSDLDPNPDLFTDAADAALSLLDADLAERLAHAATSTGGGYRAYLTRAIALVVLSRGSEAEEMLSRILASDREAVEVALLRAMNLLLLLNRPAAAAAVLSDAMTAAPPELHSSLTAGCALVHAYEGDPLNAVSAAEHALRSSGLVDTASIWALGSLILAYGDVGRAEGIAPIAARTYDLIAAASHASLPGFTVCELHTRSLVTAGYVREAGEIAARVSRQVSDAPGWVQPLSTLLMGQAALAAGRLTDARRWLEQPFTYPAETTSYIIRVWACALIRAQAMAGDHETATNTLRLVDSLHTNGFGYLEPEMLVTRAWVAAAGGATTEAIALARRGAERAAERNQHALEGVCLHTATRFGDTATSPRLQELAGQVDGPRAPAAAQHATALAAGDADGLLEASRQFEDMGDLLAAMDAAAHAATTYRHHKRNGSALTAAARAQRLADTCVGADTPALRAAKQPTPLTARQREIITLAAQGLSNKQIAEKMMLSVRTVEGHLYRASLKTGLAGRDDLGGTVTGR
ncbi:helix-turn-helix transcriptional regulator [Rhodococcus jostii]|uniref:AAA ATPase domain-containing protein n=1 Tax=Rhodococcus jostii TaxID=132919 RepID=A0A1H4J8L0_RHOJO|nr:LuxR family transcriptional regulator [Rhodococcus jostii]SEB41978.1 AAA ATPase domain-containing protein [Rhodococcus jostii]